MSKNICARKYAICNTPALYRCFMKALFAGLINTSGWGIGLGAVALATVQRVNKTKKIAASLYPNKVDNESRFPTPKYASYSDHSKS